MYTKIRKQLRNFQGKLKKLFISVEMSYSCCYGLWANLDFPDFLQKSVL